MLVSLLKKKELLSYVAMWVKLEDIMLRTEIKQSQEGKCCLTPLHLRNRADWKGETGHCCLNDLELRSTSLEEG